MTKLLMHKGASYRQLQDDTPELIGALCPPEAYPELSLGQRARGLEKIIVETIVKVAKKQAENPRYDEDDVRDALLILFGITEGYRGSKRPRRCVAAAEHWDRRPETMRKKQRECINELADLLYDGCNVK